MRRSVWSVAGALACILILAATGEAGRLPVSVYDDEIHIGDNVTISFQRTLRVPDDGRTYGLPPGLGRLPIRRVEDYAARVPASWRRHGGVIIPMYQREAMWIDFRGSDGPAAVKVAAGMINALTGDSWSNNLEWPQDYVVVPQQPWLDGFKTGRGTVRQFVAMPLGSGLTVEGQITGEEKYGGIQILAFEPFPNWRYPEREGALGEAGAPSLKGGGMGLGEGGKIHQRILPDPYGIDAWDQSRMGRIFVHIVNSRMWRAITGELPPPTPITIGVYNQYGYPWMPFYEEDIGSSGTLDSIRTIDGSGGNVDDGQW